VESASWNGQAKLARGKEKRARAFVARAELDLLHVSFPRAHE
jgi:hypothetical protein